MSSRLIEVFMNLIEPDTNGGCWIWTGSTTQDGYGYGSVLGTTVFAHRLSHMLFKGPLVQGKCVLHKCNVRPCVNPDHLYEGTNRDNVDDRLRTYGCDPEIRKRREHRDIISLTGKRKYNKSGLPRRPSAPGSRLGHNKTLIAEQVREIRASNAPGTLLADRYGVAPGTISKIRSRQLWATLPD